jgi:carbamoyl-phosphate synthase large subunit
MKSTGEVMGIDEDFDIAFFKSQLAAGQKINNIKNIFISVKDEDKESMSKIIEELVSFNFSIFTTKGTYLYLKEKNIPSEVINKVAEGSPHIVEYLRQGKIDLVINTTENKQAIRDSFTIRRTAVDLNVPYYTNLRSAKILCKSIIKLQNTELKVKPIQKHHVYSIKNSFEF